MARLYSCNVLQVGSDACHVWQFDAGKFSLSREQAVPAGQSLPGSLVGKTWTSLWQPKLNVAWLPTENVFLRVVQLPKADMAETRSMVEFQLEKLSPLPVTQIVWGIHVLHQRHVPKPAATSPAEAEGGVKTEDLQTIILIIVARDQVEEFLGKLERDGFLADRIETPLLDKLQATPAADDGAWIYLDEDSPRGSALVAWRRDGVLQSLGLIHLPSDKNQTDLLREQLAQMTWAGEIEGWLTSSPQWHLVAGSAAATQWEAVFGKALETSVKVVSPPSSVELAAATARRTAKADDAANLLPREYSARYHQQFVDRLWLRGLTSVGLLYTAGVIIYFIALAVLKIQVGKVEAEVDQISGSYTNAIQLKARYQIIKERQDLKFAALDCWKTTAELMPTGVTLESLDFRDGSKLSLRGTAPADKAVQLNDFNAAMRKATVNGQPLFTKVDGLAYTAGAKNNIAWSFSCELKHREETP
jgi:Tfp pilus assembly protein PilN